MVKFVSNEKQTPKKQEGQIMKIVRYNPFNELTLWNNSFNSLFNDSFFKSTPKNHWHPVVDIIDEEDTVTLNAELPGMKKDDISVNIDEKVLTISGKREHKKEEKKSTYYRTERSYGSFKRSFTLSDDIVTDDVTADYKDGVLSIILKKDNTKEEIKKIAIN